MTATTTTKYSVTLTLKNGRIYTIPVKATDEKSAIIKAQRSQKARGISTWLNPLIHATAQQV